MKLILLLVSVLSSPLLANLEVALSTTEESTSSRSIISLTAKNSFPQAVQSARVMLFAFDESGVVVGHESAWIIAENQSDHDSGFRLEGLDAGDTTELKLSIPTERRAVTCKVTFTKIILADGSRVNPHKQVIAYEK
jgi:hypothetical protein